MDLGSSVDDDLGVRILQWRKISLIQISNEQKAGRIIAAGMTKEVRFEPVRGDVAPLMMKHIRKSIAAIHISLQ